MQQSYEVGYDGISKDGHQYKIVKRCGDNVWIEYSSNVHYCRTEPLKMVSVYRNTIKDWLAPTKDFKGCRGFSGSTKSSEYKIWRGVVIRGTNSLQESYSHTRISKDFLIFDDFLQWLEKNKIRGDVELDKDLFSFEDFKIYSPETCCFLPREINLFLKDRRSKTIYFDGEVYYISNLFGERLPKAETIFKSQTDCMNFVNFCMTDKLRILANKYKDQILPHVYSRLLDFEFDLGYTVCNKTLKSHGKSEGSRSVTHTREKQASLVRSFLSGRL